MMHARLLRQSHYILAMMAALSMPLPSDCFAKTQATSQPDKNETPKSASQKSKSPTAGDRSDARADAFVNTQAFDQALISKLVFDMTNVERRKAGLSSLTANPFLLKSATEHSQDMASRVYFAHKSKGFINRSNPSDRVHAVGYDPGMVAENIAMIPTYNGQKIQSYPGGGRQVVETNYNTYRQVAEITMREWMNSPGHRENILNPRLKCLGVGVALGVKNNVPYVYLTQNFGG